MKYLRSFYKRHRGMAALALLLLLGQVVGTLLIPALIANVVDLGILPGDMDAILRTGGQMLAVALLSAAVAAAGSWVTADLGARFGFEMRSLLLRKSQELSLHQFDEVGVSSMITRTTSDITNLQQTMGMVLQMVVPAPLIVGASIVMTAMVTPVMAVIQVGFMAALAAVAAVVLRKSNALSRSIQVRLDRINRVVREAVTGVRVIRAFGNEAYEEARSGDAYRSYADNMIRLNRLFAVAIPVVWMLMGALMAVVLWAGGVLTLGGGMEVGQITAVTEYSILTMGYLLMAVSVLTTLPKARACLARLTALLDTRPDVEDGAASAAVAGPGRPAVEFDHVSFSYPGAEEPVLRDISFTLYPGQTAAVIGSTGSGKSTLADGGGGHPRGRRRCAYPHPAGAAGAHRLRPPEGVPVQRYHRGESAHGPAGRYGRGAVAGPGHCPGRRLCGAAPFRAGCPGGPGGHQLLRRSAAAAVHRPGAGEGCRGAPL